MSHTALADMANLRTFLYKMLSEEGAIRYANNMKAEIKLLSVYAECFGRTTSKTLRNIHPQARPKVNNEG